MMKLAENIRRFRKSKGWTQTELATVIGATQKSITSYETGFKIPSVQKLFIMTQTFNCTMDDLFGFVEPEIKEEQPSVHKNSRIYQMQGYYEKLSPEEQRIILKQTKALAEKKEK